MSDLGYDWLRTSYAGPLYIADSDVLRRYMLPGMVTHPFCLTDFYETF
jgi:hypothetical protein